MSASTEFLPVAYVCKHCRQPGVARYSKTCDQDWLDKLHPLLIHDRCAKALSGMTRAADALIHACLSIANRVEGHEKIAQRLSHTARRYADAFAARWDCPVLFSEDFTTMLRERPERVGEILSQYRKQALRQPIPLPESRMADA